MERLGGRDLVRATEAAVEDGVQWITIIKEGTSENNRHYARSTLEKAVESKVYNNLRMFVDHSDGPPLKRSMRDLVSAITDTKLDTSFPDGKARVRGAVEWIDEEWQKKIEKADKHIGVSHDAMLRGTRSVKNGRRFEDISEIVRGNSVDWVIYPSAGGGFENSFLAQEGVTMKDAIAWDDIDEDMLKEKAPDLYKKLTHAKEETEAPPEEDEEETEEEDTDDEEAQESKSNSKKRVVKVSKSKVERQVEAIVRRSFETVERERQEAAEKKSAAADQVEALVNKSTLPDLTKKRVIKQFSGAESFEEDAVKEAISEAKKEVAAIAGPRVSGAGPSKTSTGGGSLGRSHEALERVFKIKPSKGAKPEGKGNDKKKSDDEEEEE